MLLGVLSGGLYSIDGARSVYGYAYFYGSQHITSVRPATRTSSSGRFVESNISRAVQRLRSLRIVVGLTLCVICLRKVTSRLRSLCDPVLMVYNWEFFGHSRIRPGLTV